MLSSCNSPETICHVPFMLNSADISSGVAGLSRLVGLLGVVGVSGIEEEIHHASRKSYEDLVQEIIDNHMELSHIYDCLDAITDDYPDQLRKKTFSTVQGTPRP